MRIIFCDNVLIDQYYPDSSLDVQPHLGLLSLLGVAFDSGHEGAIFDPNLALMQKKLSLTDNFYRDMARNLLDLEPDALGFTTLGCNLICTYKVALYVRTQRPDLPIILGGPHATILHKDILREFDVFDLIVRQEAEGNLPSLLKILGTVDTPERVKAFAEVPGLTFRKGRELVSTPPAPLIDDLDLLPWPAYQHYPIEELGLKSMRVEAGRGCPFSCTFCSTASFFGRRYRLKSASRLVDELDFLNRCYGIADFSLTHDLFTVNKGKVREFCRAVAGRGYTWSCSARMDCVDNALLSDMRDSGCRSIYYGVETGSRRMQKISDKHLDLDLVEPVLDATGDLRMKAVVSLITGFPEETKEDQAATMNLLGNCTKRSQELIDLQLHLLTPEPGTALHYQYSDRLEYDGYITDFNFPTMEADDAHVISSLPGLFMNHHYYPTEIERSRHIFAEQSFRLLIMLGFPILHNMLQSFEGQLSRLVDALYTYTIGAERPLDHAAVAAFAAEKWGSDNILTSAVRYLMTGIRLRAAASAVASSGSTDCTDPGASLQLSPSAALLTDIHKVPDLLIDLSQDACEVDEERYGPARDAYLVFVERDRPSEVRNFEVGGLALSLIQWLHEPRTIADVASWTRQFDAHGEMLDGIVDRLRRLGLVSLTS
jgi:radical SAM superfamily enzyme YgiQ (UPF0313 family)